MACAPCSRNLTSSEVRYVRTVKSRIDDVKSRTSKLLCRMVGLIILHVVLLLLCVSTHPHGNEAASSYLSEIPFTRSAKSIIALLHEHNVSTVHAPGSDQFQASVLLENGMCFDHCPSLVLRPRSVWDVSTAVAIARMYSIPTSVRSGHQLLHLCIYLLL